jgi:preprotein translocase subunit SecB
MNTQAMPDGAQGAPDSPHLRVLAQYVKELSFENPMAAASARAYEVQPSIDMGVEVKSRPFGDGGDVHEVDLRISVQAKRDDQVMFVADLVYAGLFQFVNVTADDVEPLIWIECPRLLFPFSRQILAEITREGGYPPLLINPIDFTPLYWAELRDRQDRTAGGDEPLGAPAGEGAAPGAVSDEPLGDVTKP